MLRWRNWRLKYVGVQDRALKLRPGTGLLFIHVLARWVYLVSVIHIKKIINTVLRKLFDLRCGNQLPYAQFLGTHKRKLFDLWKGNQLYTIFELAQAKFSLCDYWFK